MTQSTRSLTRQGVSTQPRRRVLSGTRVRVWITSITLSAVCLLWIYPFLWVISSSLKSNAEIYQNRGLIPTTFHWDNYQRAWTTGHVGQYFWNSVITTVASVLIVVVSSAMIGYALGRYSFPGKKIVVAALVATVFLPEGYTIIPIFDLISKLGLDNSLIGIILGLTGGANIVVILLFAGYFAQLPKELEEAAVLDGAGFVRVFLQIMLPLARPVIATGIILQFIASWNAFLLPLVLTLTRPELRTLAVGMFAFKGQYSTDWSGMAAAATLGVLPIITVFLFLQRYFVEGITGSVKQ